jgi:hypothetical protein
VTSSRAGEVVTVRGADNLERTLHDAADDIDNLQAANAAAAGIAARGAKAGAPKVSGALSESTGPSEVTPAGWGVGATVEYAGPIIGGWRERNITPNPYIQRAVESTEPAWMTAYEKHAERTLAQVKGI